MTLRDKGFESFLYSEVDTTAQLKTQKITSRTTSENIKDGIIVFEARGNVWGDINGNMAFTVMKFYCTCLSYFEFCT